MTLSVPILSESQVAAVLMVSTKTLRNWRSLGRGPQWMSNPDTGKFLGYPREALDDWLRDGQAI